MTMIVQKNGLFFEVSCGSQFGNSYLASIEDQLLYLHSTISIKFCWIRRTAFLLQITNYTAVATNHIFSGCQKNLKKNCPEWFGQEKSLLING